MGNSFDFQPLDGNDRNASLGPSNRHRWRRLMEWNRGISISAPVQVEFAAAGFTVTPDRMSVVNFSMSIDIQPYTFMFNRPKQLSRALLFIQPYTTEVRPVCFLSYTSFYKKNS